MNSEIFRFCHFHKDQVRHVISQHLTAANHAMLDHICLLKEGAIVTAHLGGDGKAVTARCIVRVNKGAADTTIFMIVGNSSNVYGLTDNFSSADVQQWFSLLNVN